MVEDDLAMVTDVEAMVDHEEYGVTTPEADVHTILEEEVSPGLTEEHTGVDTRNGPSWWIRRQT